MLVDGEYDIFEKFCDGGVRWLECVQGIEGVAARLAEVAGQTQNECFAINIRTQEIIGRVNVAKAAE